MKNLLIDARTPNYVAAQVRVSRNVGKVEDSSSTIRFVSYAMIAVSLALVAFKAISVVA